MTRLARTTKSTKVRADDATKVKEKDKTDSKIDKVDVCLAMNTFEHRRERKMWVGNRQLRRWRSPLWFAGWNRWRWLALCISCLLLCSHNGISSEFWRVIDRDRVRARELSAEKISGTADRLCWSWPSRRRHVPVKASFTWLAQTFYMFLSCVYIIWDENYW